MVENKIVMLGENGASHLSKIQWENNLKISLENISFEPLIQAKLVLTVEEASLIGIRHDLQVGHFEMRVGSKDVCIQFEQVEMLPVTFEQELIFYLSGFNHEFLMEHFPEVYSFDAEDEKDLHQRLFAYLSRGKLITYVHNLEEKNAVHIKSFTLFGAGPIISIDVQAAASVEIFIG